MNSTALLDVLAKVDEFDVFTQLLTTRRDIAFALVQANIPFAHVAREQLEVSHPARLFDGSEETCAQPTTLHVGGDGEPSDVGDAIFDSPPHSADEPGIDPHPQSESVKLVFDFRQGLSERRQKRIIVDLRFSSVCRPLQGHYFTCVSRSKTDLANLLFLLVCLHRAPSGGEGCTALILDSWTGVQPANMRQGCYCSHHHEV